MSVTNLLAAAVVLIGATDAPDQGPPLVTGVRMAEALRVLEHEETPLSYTLTVRSTVSKTDGSDRKESESVEAVSRDAKGTTTVKVLKATRDGRASRPKRSSGATRDAPKRARARTTTTGATPASASSSPPARTPGDSSAGSPRARARS